MMRPNMLNKVQSPFWFLALVVLASCAKPFHLEQSAVTLQMPTEPVTLHGDHTELQVAYKVAPKAFVPKGVAVVRLIQIQNNETSEIGRDTWVGPKVKGVKGRSIEPAKGGEGELGFKQPTKEVPASTEYWLELVSFTGSSSQIKKAKGFLEEKSYHKAPEKAHQFRVKISEGISLLSRTGRVISTTRPVASGFIADTIEPFEATIYFELNKSVIRESERKKKEILQLVDFLSKTKEILKIEVNGYASPDGEIQFNNELADERATEAGKFVINALRSSQGLKDIQYDLDNSKLYVQNKGTEDWKGLLRGIEFARIPQKDQVRSIIENSNLSSAEKQSKLKGMRESWDIITEDYLPPLRRANMVINTKVPPRTFEERMQLIRMKSPELSASEMLATAEQAKDATRQAEILELAKGLYPSDHRAYNNLAVLDMEAGRLETAARNLDAAAEAAPGSPEVLHNQGWVAYLQKDWSKLNLVVKRAQNIGQSLPEFEAIMAIRSGKYADAVSALPNKNQDLLLALAHCLNRDYDAAAKALKGLDRQNPDVLYLSAVVAARSKNSSGVQRDLEALVASDPKVKSSLRTDPEFASFRQETFFKNLTL
ncbi:MAG: hypothetical protein EBQ67_04310 [Sphingobacteriia bacterium]|nr:hypothetical protein [Sphingobacteriia bacterium]